MLSGDGDLCGPGWYHCYQHPLLAVLLNPIYSDIKYPRLWKIEVSGEGKHDYGLKSGYQSMTLIKELPLPEITLTQRVSFGILCTLEVYKDPAFIKWANSWLSGDDRSEESSEFVAEAASTYAWKYSRTSAAAAWAAWAASRAAWAAYRAASPKAAARAAAKPAEWTAAHTAARAAYMAASSRAAADHALDLISLAEKAILIK